ncbi:F-box domain [Arabidopsis suecica]|uniref:F-box domain n=1 Tax=Arabidopsis suecica TaxID=45249 RepID=A0A8T1YLI5_ARASU|nr:F-box domain [Arabidopsis suecica]
MNLQVEPPEKKKWKKKTKNSSSPHSPPSSSSPSLSLLPDEIVVNCLARISRSYYPTLSIVSKSFRSILSSTELYAARSHLGSTEQCVYVCIWDRSYQFPQWLRLLVNPNQTLANSLIKKRRKKTTGQMLVPITSSNFTSVSKATVVVGSEIYIIGSPVDSEPSSAVRVLDCCSHTWRDAPSMTIVRMNALACFHDGKIYVMGGCQGLEDEPWAEVFDTKTKTWERLPDPGTEVRKCSIYRMVEIEGKIEFGNVNETYAYDTKQCKWESCVKQKLRSECMIENVSYGYWNMRLLWYDNDIQKDYWKRLEGLDSLAAKYMRNGGSSGNTTKLVSCGGKLLLLWEGYMKHNPNNRKKIWCAVIAIEKRDGGGVCGIVERVDVLHTVPRSCQLLHCLVVSV